MKEPISYMWAFLLLVCSATGAWACDVCGSSVNANYLGILPQFRKHFAGVRYMHIGTASRALPSLFEANAPGYTQSIERTELWGRYYPSPRVQFFAFIPYQYSIKSEAGVVTQTNGLSDISIMTNYIFINTGDTGWLDWKNTFSAGIGLKLPTGRFDPASAAALQSGTGSWDGMVNAIYTTRFKKAGLNVDFNMRFNSTAKEYRFGNRITSSMRLFYWHKYKMISFLPHIGVLAEYAAHDRRYGITQQFTGGNGYYAVAGVDFYLRRITAGVIYTIPVSEHLNGGYTQTNSRISLQLLYLFN